MNLEKLTKKELIEKYKTGAKKLGFIIGVLNHAIELQGTSNTARFDYKDRSFIIMTREHAKMNGYIR